MLIYDMAPREIAAFKVNDPDTVLFFRSSDGYEMHGADAVLISESLWLPMLWRPGDPDFRLTIPADRLEEALVRLALARRHVAIVERVTDASAAPVGLVVLPADESIPDVDAFLAESVCEIEWERITSTAVMRHD